MSLDVLAALDLTLKREVPKGSKLSPPVEAEPSREPEETGQGQVIDFSLVRETIPGDRPVVAALSRMIDAATAHAAAERYKAGRGSGQGLVAKKRIGAGYIGLECDRQLAFKYHKIPPSERAEEDQFLTKGELNRHAESGHWAEEKTIQWFRETGIVIETEVPGEIGYDGRPKQHGFMAGKDPATGQYRLAGEVDGVITALPESVPEDFALDLETLRRAVGQPPIIWESKKATDKKWKRFNKEGVKKSDPKYYGQIQTCMAHMQIPRALFSMLNLDTMKYFFEVIDFEPAYAQGLIDRAAKVITSRGPEEFARVSSTHTDQRCRFCDWKETCWTMR
ncbi:hypothetical protein [Roseibium aggregatum]|uniref:PD-(D/E)XK nuclease superfamily protein n=1 Tax=Roseibium aggregatum TaxID=187304 RepID=A0A0M6Y7J8_9HYPH|nr:hypothetical protein [Roseibium aggregatum]CTQ45684.1 hypothetical protein LAL4801_04139 [Roseibium aggregatum]